jgi:hypothetical protein
LMHTIHRLVTGSTWLSDRNNWRSPRSIIRASTCSPES